MTRKQFAMFIKVLRETCSASLKGDLYSIKPRVGSVYELCYHSKGKMVILHVGKFDDCVEAASDFVSNSYEIS
jgi:hypothetical protein